MKFNQLPIVALTSALLAVPTLGVASDHKELEFEEAYLHFELNDPQREVRLAAIEALADLEHEFAVHSFAGLLSDPDARIRLHAVNALGEIGGDDAIPYLLQARYDSHSKIRANAAAILQETGVAEID